MAVGIHCGPTLVPIGPSRAKRAAALLNPHALDHDDGDYETTPSKAPSLPQFHSYIGSKRYHKLLRDQIFKLESNYQFSHLNPKWKSAHLTTLLHLVDACLDSPNNLQLVSIKSEVEHLCNLQQRLNRRLNAQKAQEESAANALNQASLSTQDSLGSWICVDTPGKAPAATSAQKPQQASIESFLQETPPPTGDAVTLEKISKPIKPQQGTLLVPATEQVKYKTLDDIKSLAEASPQVQRQVGMKKDSTKKKQTSLKRPKGTMVVNAAKDWTFH